MNPSDRLRRLIRLPARARTIRTDVDAEIDFHLEATERELIAHGLTPDEARRQARQRFGDVETVRDRLGSLDRHGARRQARVDFGRGWWQDLRRSVRSLGREPGFAAVVALTLALGMGANATMFRVLDRVLLRPAPHVRDDGSLSLLYFQRETPEFGRVTQTSQSYPVFDQLRTQFARFGDLAAWWVTTSSSGRGATARKLEVSYVTPNFLPLLGVRPWAGRFFDAADWEMQGEPTIVVTNAFAASTFGSPAASLGKSVPIGRKSYTVVGVTPPGFVGPDLRPVDVFVSMPTGIGEMIGKEWKTNKNSRWLRIVMQRAPGVSAVQAGAAATTSIRNIGRILSKNDSLVTVVAGSIIPARRPEGAPAGRIALWLSGVSLLVLLVACANVANLLLARTLRRRRELAVHLALGVSRGRMTRSMVSETLLLGALAGALALVLSVWGDSLLRATLLKGMPWEGSPFELRQMAFVALLVLVAAVLAGLLPALIASRTPLMEALKSGVRDGGGRRRGLRSSLVVIQGTLSVILLVGAGLFVQSFRRASSLDLGFAPDGLLIATPDVSGLATSPEDLEQRWARIEERVRRVPGVASVAQSVTTPFESQWERTILMNGDTLPPLKGGGPYANAVSSQYFTAMQAPIRRGRDFTAQDRKGSTPVAIVNESMSRQLWPGREAIGQCFGTDDVDGCVTVVGVVADSRITAVVDNPPAQFYQPLGQWNPDMRVLMVRLTSVDATSAALNAVRRAVLELEPSLPFVEVRPMTLIVDEQLQTWRLGAAMFGLFGLLGLLVAALGLYSVIAHDVSQRAHEIGVRMALGARRDDVARLVVGSGLRQALGGVAIGITIAWIVSVRLADLLFHTSSRDPVIYAAVVVLLLLVALVASLLPARRASRVDPVTVLRGD